MLEENSDVANTNSNEFEDNDEEEDTDKEQDKLSSPQSVSQTDDTFHRGLDILQKLFPQKDKVRYFYWKYDLESCIEGIAG